MSPPELTHALVLRLIRDVGRDRGAMKGHAVQVGDLANQIRKKGDGPLTAALALALHHYYTALEGALSRTVRALEGELPSASDWHIALLEHAAQPLLPIRPALLSQECLSSLTELRRFRHFLRNAYAVELDPSFLMRLAEILEQLQPQLDGDLGVLLQFLSAIRDGCVR